MTAKVSPMECSRWTPSSGPRASGRGRRWAGARARRRCRRPVRRKTEVPRRRRRRDEQLAALDVDAPGDGVKAKAHAGRFQVGDAPVGQVAPVGDLARDVVGDAADGEVRVGVGHDHGDLGGRGRARGPADVPRMPASLPPMAMMCISPVRSARHRAAKAGLVGTATLVASVAPPGRRLLHTLADHPGRSRAPSGREGEGR